MKKIASLILILISLSGFYQIQAQNQIYKKSVAGSWLGKLDLGAVSLRLIYNLRINENDSIVASLDSPDQGAKGIKIGPVTLDSNKIKIMAPLLLSEYNGTIKNDTLIEGTFKQAGKTLPLNLKKLKKTFTFNRPQKPKSPFPYISEDVTFKNEKADITLAGTLTVPEGNGPYPAVIMITGSGSQNRNEELMGHEPFLVIADHLSRNGIAVLRYDDRGVGKSQNTSSPSTSADFATDAESAFNYLKTNTRIDPKRIGLAGHSEGGIIASMTASANRGIGFVISLAGPGVTGERILYKQNYDLSKALGMEEKELKAAISMSRKMYSVVKIETALEGFPVSAATLTSPWYRSFLVTDPADYWEKVTCPVLALNGEKDLQVAADINLPAIEKSLKSGGNNAVKTIKFPELNHLFQHCKTGLPSEYGEIEETISPEVLKAMSDWIHGL
jgi:pimeloyl-ACP methyl ester carboxylesterase